MRETQIESAEHDMTATSSCSAASLGTLVQGCQWVRALPGAPAPPYPSQTVSFSNRAACTIALVMGTCSVLLFNEHSVQPCFLPQQPGPQLSTQGSALLSVLEHVSSSLVIPRNRQAAEPPSHDPSWHPQARGGAVWSQPLSARVLTKACEHVSDVCAGSHIGKRLMLRTLIDVH